MFLAALAVTDDMGAVLVKLIYASDVNVVPLLVAGLLLLGLVAANRTGIRRAEVYVLLGVGVWLAILASGIHFEQRMLESLTNPDAKSIRLAPSKA